MANNFGSTENLSQAVDTGYWQVRSWSCNLQSILQSPSPARPSCRSSSPSRLALWRNRILLNFSERNGVFGDEKRVDYSFAVDAMKRLMKEQQRKSAVISIITCVTNDNITTIFILVSQILLLLLQLLLAWPYWHWFISITIMKINIIMTIDILL